MSATAPAPNPQDVDPAGATYSELATPTAALIRCDTPPDLATLTAGDMVICSDQWGIDQYIADAARRGIHVRAGAYRLEHESLHPRRQQRTLRIDYAPGVAGPEDTPPGRIITPAVIEASTGAFAATWDALTASLPDPGQTYLPAADHVPAEFLPYLPYPMLNPAQAQAAPAIQAARSVVVVAPTGAGKTVLGQIAALRAILGSGRKAAWLVPQRSLTAELDRSLDAWRRAGLNVLILAGGTSVDNDAARAADIWVATTEKFESLCRATSLRSTIAEIDTLIVDEIHLLGDPTRGPLLENLLARIVRDADASATRIVGLSATAANAASVAEWLDAELVEVTWRPTRHTTQLVPIPAPNRTKERANRTRVAVGLTRTITADGGSALVFCGSKANLRSTALAIAASRGAPTAGVDRDDIDAVHAACRAARVGLHYSDWPYKSEAEREFRERRYDVLVATSTLAAGVNTPAKAVIVADTHIGQQPMEISMVQQMFGRAGRAGAEREGWAFLLTRENETAVWRRAISDGYTIRSGLRDTLPDHLLGEIVQGNLTSRQDVRAWWESTLAYAQNSDDGGLLEQALATLDTARFTATDSDGALSATALGQTTSRMMIAVDEATGLLDAARQARLPQAAAAAEEQVVDLLARTVEALRDAPDSPPDQAPGLEALLAARGRIESVQQPRRAGRGGGYTPGFPGVDASRVGMLVAARSPHVLNGPGQFNLRRLRVTPGAFAAALYDAPRHLAWLAALGPLNVVPAWIPVVAGDLGRRITWRSLQPQRGDGRLLWACERLAGTLTPERVVEQVWQAATGSGYTDIDQWQDTPPGPYVEAATYRRMLEDRCSSGGHRITLIAPHESDPAGQLWEPGEGAVVQVTFTPRGDAVGTGWLAAFAHRGARAHRR